MRVARGSPRTGRILRDIAQTGETHLANDSAGHVCRPDLLADSPLKNRPFPACLKIATSDNRSYHEWRYFARVLWVRCAAPFT
jgi:hypothetical protein